MSDRSPAPSSVPLTPARRKMLVTMTHGEWPAHNAVKAALGEIRRLEARERELEGALRRLVNFWGSDDLSGIGQWDSLVLGGKGEPETEDNRIKQVAEARAAGICRICRESISTPYRLDQGHEYVHSACLEKGASNPCP
jgi:hypothetical protein